MSCNDRCLVGNPLPEWALAPIHGGAQFHVDPLGPVLLLYADAPSEAERRTLVGGRVELALMSAGQHTMFALYRIDGLTDGWCDVPWGAAMLSRPARALLAESDRFASLLLVLADSASRSVVARRGILPSVGFENALYRLVKTMWRNLPDSSAQLCAEEIEAAARRYPSTEAMLRDAVQLGDAGTIEVIG